MNFGNRIFYQNYTKFPFTFPTFNTYNQTAIIVKENTKGNFNILIQKEGIDLGKKNRNFFMKILCKWKC